MKSVQVNSFPPDDEGEYSELQVLCSNAGWYIGTVFTFKDGGQEPGSRDSEYFATKQEAQDELDLWKKGEGNTLMRIDP